MSLAAWLFSSGQFIVLMAVLQCVSSKLFSILPSKKLCMKKHCFPRNTFITSSFGSFNKHEWSKDWVYCVPKLDEKNLCLSKGSLKTEVAMEVNNFCCCQTHPWHTLGTGMTRYLISARNNFQRYFWSSLSISELIDFFFPFKSAWTWAVTCRCSHDKRMVLGATLLLTRWWPEAPAHPAKPSLKHPSREQAALFLPKNTRFFGLQELLLKATAVGSAMETDLSFLFSNWVYCSYFR